MTRRLLLLLALLNLGCLAKPTSPGLDERPPETGDWSTLAKDHRLAAAAFAADQLWLRGVPAGDKINPRGMLLACHAKGTPCVRWFNRGIVDIRRVGENLWALIVDHRGFAWVLTWQRGEWTSLGPALGGAEGAIALAEMYGSPVIVTPRSVHRLMTQGEWYSVELSDELPWGVQISAAAPRVGDSIYVGFFAGEWGNGLHRIDVDSGQVERIEPKREPTGAGFRSNLDTPTGVIADPDHPDCVIVSDGLVHMLPAGALYRVCGSHAEILFEKEWLFERKVSIHRYYVPFYSLAPAADGFWTVADSILRFRDGRMEVAPCPSLESRGGLMIGELAGEVAVLCSDIAAGVSTGGGSYLIVPLR